MLSAWQHPAVAAPPRSRIHAAVADFDDVRRARIVSAVRESQLFDVTAEIMTPEQCRYVATDLVPELVICPREFIPQADSADTADTAATLFPLFVVLGTAEISNRVVCSVPAYPGAAELQESIASAASRILTLKAGELSSLIHRYLQHSVELPSPVRTLVVERDGQSIVLPARQIYWIEAAGNYVKLHTESGSFEARESIKAVHARLAPGFARVHRGALVNVDAVVAQIVANGVPVAVALTDGTQVAVGPSYRSEIPAATPVVVTSSA